MMERLEKWAEPRYGRRMTREEIRAGNADIPHVSLREAFNPPRHFPKGHVREYDPTGVHTYADQNRSSQE